MDAEWARVEKSIEIDQSLRAFAAAGVEVTYHACDVADAGALAAVLDAVRRQSGPIEGISARRRNRTARELRAQDAARR